MQGSKQVKNKIPFEFLKAVFGYDGEKQKGNKKESRQTMSTGYLFQAVKGNREINGALAGGKQRLSNSRTFTNSTNHIEHLHLPRTVLGTRDTKSGQDPERNKEQASKHYFKLCLSATNQIKEDNTIN